MSVSVLIAVPAIAVAIYAGYYISEHYMETAGFLGNIGQAVFSVSVIGAGIALAFAGGLYFIIGLLMITFYFAVFWDRAWSAKENLEDSSWRRRLNG